MANWVEGKLKIRGKTEDIKRWVEECLHCYTTNWLGDGAHTELVEGAVRFEHDPESEEMYLYVDKNGDKSSDNRAQRLQVSGLCADLPQLLATAHRNPCSEAVPRRKKEKSRNADSHHNGKDTAGKIKERNIVR